MLNAVLKVKKPEQTYQRHDDVLASEADSRSNRFGEHLLDNSQIDLAAHADVRTDHHERHETQEEMVNEPDSSHHRNAIVDRRKTVVGRRRSRSADTGRRPSGIQRFHADNGAAEEPPSDGKLRHIQR